MRIDSNPNVWAIIVYALIGFQLLDFNITWFMARIPLQIRIGVVFCGGIFSLL